MLTSPTSAHMDCVQVCSDLKLDLRWFEAINSYMQTRLEECVEVRIL